jgi:nanoRNase/pAp phosphatase (c-di-AMP/oligoRNAs hydrolase)
MIRSTVSMPSPHPTRTRPRPSSARHAARIALIPRKSPDDYKAKLDRLVQYARMHRRALVLTHDNPDPDSMAAAVALSYLLERLAGVQSIVAYGGIVGRAENRALIRVLKLPVVPISRVVFDDFDLICMVDTQPEQGNHSLPARHFPDVVIDHHPERPESRLAPIADVGRELGATSTVVADYFRASGLEMPSDIATALFYGIKSDTRDLGRETKKTDVAAYLWLFPMVDKEALGEIEHPRLPVDYFKLYHRAIEKAALYDDAVVCDLSHIYSPDMVAEIAERFLYLDDVKWSLAFAEYEGGLYFSIRTRDKRMNAGRIIRDVIEPRGGSAGGHGSMAGARIGVRKMGASALAKLKQEIVLAFLKEFGVKPKRPRKIV